MSGTPAKAKWSQCERIEWVLVSTAHEFADVYTGVYSRLVGQITVITQSREEAQDIVQEALFRAWVRWPRIGNYDDPEGWVRRVAMNLAVSHWRRIRRLTSFAGDESDQVGAVDPEQVATQAVELRRALAQLSSRERAAVVLFYVEDLSTADVARVMGVRVGTAKSLLSRARRRLGVELHDQSVDAPAAAKPTVRARHEEPR